MWVRILIVKIIVNDIPSISSFLSGLHVWSICLLLCSISLFEVSHHDDYVCGICVYCVANVILNIRYEVNVF